MKINLFFCLAVVVIMAACIITLLILYQKLSAQHEALRESYFRVEQLNSELRTQRHDYLNHLQVVYGLMELAEYEELHNYLAPVFKDMMKTGKALKTSKPALNALLKAKMDEAEGRQIDFYVEVKSDLNALRVEDWELCRVLANLIDNAMTALCERSEAIVVQNGSNDLAVQNGSENETAQSGADHVMAAPNRQEREKMIRLEIMEDREFYLFSVANNGPRIPEHMREEIFRQGFTTKREEGHGLGLSIVMNVIKAYKGSLELVSEEETVFTFRLPKEERR